MSHLSPELQALSWALLHFLWQGVVIGAAVALALRLTRRRSPQLRYALACSGLLACLAWPLATYLQGSPAGAGSGLAQPIELVHAAAVAPRPDIPLGLRLKVLLLPWLPAIFAAWTLGTSFLGLRLLGGWLWLQRVRFLGLRVEEAWERRARDLARAMGVGLPVRLRLSSEVSMPVVLGALRPLVLLPVCVVSGLAPDAIETLIVHELAHVRRHDYLVNLIQSVVEVVLFYHPAVWWISRRVRTERELCCDDAAVVHCGDPVRYAHTLNRLDDLRAPSAAMAAGGGNLMLRIKRLLVPELEPARSPWTGILAASALSTLFAAGLMAQKADAPPVPAARSTPKAAPKAAKAPRAVPSAEAPAASSAIAPAAESTPAASASSATSEKSYSNTNRNIQIHVNWDESVKEGAYQVDLNVLNASVQEIRMCLKAVEELIAGSDTRKNRSFSWTLKGPVPERAAHVALYRMSLKSLQNLSDEAYLIGR